MDCISFRERSNSPSEEKSNDRVLNKLGTPFFNAREYKKNNAYNTIER